MYHKKWELLMCNSLQWRPTPASMVGYGGQALWIDHARDQLLSLEQTWEVATWKIPHLGSCHLGK